MCTKTIVVFLIVVVSVLKAVYAEFTTVCRNGQIRPNLCPGDNVLEIEDVVGGRDQQSHCAYSEDVCTYTYPRDSPFYKRVKTACDGTKDCGILDIWDDRIMCEGQEMVVLYFTVTYNCIRPTDPPTKPTTTKSQPSSSSTSSLTTNPPPTSSASPRSSLSSTAKNVITTTVTPASTFTASNASYVKPTSSMQEQVWTTSSPTGELPLLLIICVVAGAVVIIVIIVITVCVLRRKRAKGIAKNAHQQMTEIEHNKPSVTADQIVTSTYEETTDETPVDENNRHDSVARRVKINGLTKSPVGYDEVDFPFNPAAAEATTENETESPVIGHDMTYDDVIHGETNRKRTSVDNATDEKSNEASGKPSDVYAEVRKAKASNGNATVNAYGEVKKPKVTKEEDKFEDTELVDNTLYDFGP